MGRIILGRAPTREERAAGDVGAGEFPEKKAKKTEKPEKKTIRLGKPEEKKGITEKVKGITEKFNIQKLLEKSGSDIKVKEMIYTGPVIGGAGLINRRIPTKVIEAAGRAAGLSKAGIAQVKHAIGVRRVSEVAQSLINPKSQSLIKTAMSKIFSKEAMILIGSLAGSVGLGKWAQKETPEPITFVMKDILRKADATGDWTLYNEAAAARDDLTDMSKWEQFLTWTPIISPFITIPRAIKGVIQGGKIMDEFAKQQQIQQETGESEDEKWLRIDKERDERREAERIEDEQYYAQVQRDIEKAKADARIEDERYWAKILREREEYEKAKRIAEEKYWEDVKILNAELKREETKQYQEYAKSNLNFGLL